MNSAAFDDIRPYFDHEVPGALRDLVRDPELTGFMGNWLAPGAYAVMPPVMRFLVSLYLKRELSGVENIRAFQDVIAKYAKKLVTEGATSFSYEGFERLDADQSYLFVSNHRDIAGDSMLLDYALYLTGHDTVRIAIGDNLVQRPFATSIMRLNKGFFIKRSVEGPRKAYAALLQSSQYIRASLEEKQSVWIAQSEGRSKDGLDRTDPAIVKMFLLAHRKEAMADALKGLRIVPLSISYEFDPCDLMKAKEQFVIESKGGYEKPAGEDLLSLVTGLSGHKGRVVLRLGDEVQGDYESPEAVAAEIDRQIISRMELFPVNYWALTQLAEAPYVDLHAQAQAALDSKLDEEALAKPASFDACPPEHLPYLLRMYANPVLNRHNLETIYKA